MLPVSSDTTIATESFSSVSPIAARCRDPSSLPRLRVDRERQKARRRRHAILLHDHRAVVQRRRRQEDALQQIVGEHGVEADAALDVVAKADLPLDGDDGADALRREHGRGDDELLDRVPPPLRLEKYRKNGARPKCASARRMSDWNSTITAKTM